MRRVFLGAMVLFFVVGQGFLFADRKAVDDYLKAYEAVVVEAETLAKKASISAMDMMPLQQKALTLSQSTQAIQTDSTFTLQDSQKLLALTTRYNAAIETITKKLS